MAGANSEGDDVIEVRGLSVDEIDKIRDVDRTEEIRVGYRQEGTELVEMSVDWDDGVSADAEPETKRLQPLRLAM